MSPSVQIVGHLNLITQSESVIYCLIGISSVNNHPLAHVSDTHNGKIAARLLCVNATQPPQVWWTTSQESTPEIMLVRRRCACY